MPAPAWQLEGLCLADPDLFTSDDNRGELVEEARDTCNRCPVQPECLAAALAEEGTTAANMRGSIRGGMTPTERWRISRPKKTAA
ncbi:WhiB family transcriptional regulator [Streptomyces antimycoticus]|uniref:WhiB family transcriptional regulator n=1 Tax=Streptomyces antimycoticus TaxID=68175 RepID=UPI0036E5887D